MSKPIKELLRKNLEKRFDGVTSLAVVGFTGLSAVTTRQIRGRLRNKDIKFTVVKNAVARQAFKTIGIGQAGELLDGPCAVAYGSDSVVSVVRELLEIGKEKEMSTLTVKAALLDGELFGKDQIVRLSKFPTRPEAMARVVSCLLTPGAKLAGCIVGPGRKVAALVKAIEEKAPKAEPAGEAAPTAGEAAPAASV